MKTGFIFLVIVGRSTAGLLACACFVAGPPLMASSGPEGAVDGVVSDGSGEALSGARVTLRRAAQGFERSVETGSEGRFHIEAPFRGDYELTAEREGFSVERRRVALEPGRSVGDLRIRLRPGVFSEELTVIGTRVAGGPETLRRIPGSVDVLGPEALEAARVSTTTEALRKATGLAVRDEEGLGLRPNIGVRGINPTRSTKLLLLEDGLPLAFAPYGDNATYYHPPIERFETVEVLKGSGQIAYGPVTVGGVVNYLTPEPPPRPAATLRGTAGNRGYTNLHATAGGTFGRAGFVLDAMRKQGEGARQNTHSTLHDLNAKGTLALGAGHTLAAKASYYAEDSMLTYSGLRQAEYEAGARANPFHNDAFDGWRLGGSLKHLVLLGPQAVLTTQLYTSRFSRDWWRQSSNSNQRPNDASDPACGGMANLDTTCGNEGRLRDYGLFGVEPRLRAGHRLLGVASEAELGLRAHFEWQERRQENGDTPTARGGRLVEDNRRTNAAWSGFVQNRFLLGRLTLTPGVRFEAIGYERLNRLGNEGAGVSGETSVRQWVPGVGAALALRPSLSLFAGVHRGFAPPRTEDVISNTTGGAVDLAPELSWNYELGLRSQRSGLGLDLTLFRMDYENQIIPASVAGGTGATLTNGGATLHQGFELGARVDTAGLTGSRHNVALRAAFTAVPTARFEGARFSTQPGAGNVSVTGNRLPYAPERLFNAGLSYTHPSTASAILELVHVGTQFGDDLNTVEPSLDGQRGRLPSFTIWNATVNLPFRALRSTAFLAVKNLLDRLYVADRTRGVLPGPPRTLQLGLVARF
jgi:Fe(3+) dicitrate transport protein